MMWQLGLPLRSESRSSLKMAVWPRLRIAGTTRRLPRVAPHFGANPSTSQGGSGRETSLRIRRKLSIFAIVRGHSDSISTIPASRRE